MKIKTFFKSILISALFAPIIPASAASNSISISCPSSAPINSTATCTISGYSSDAISGISANLSTNNLQITNFAVDSAWYGDANDGQIVITTDSNKTGSFVIGTATIQPTVVDTFGTISISNIIFSNGSFVEFSVSGTSASISTTTAAPQPEQPEDSEQSEDDESGSIDQSALKSLTISGYDIDFLSDQYTYTIYIQEEISSLDIMATPLNESAIITINGNKDLKDGSIIKITVEAEESESIYRIKIASTTPPTTSTTENTSFDSSILIIIICGCIIVVTIIIAFFLFRKKKPTTRPNIPVVQSTPRPTENPFINNQRGQEKQPLPDLDSIVDQPTLPANPPLSPSTQPTQQSSNPLINKPLENPEPQRPNPFLQPKEPELPKPQSNPFIKPISEQPKQSERPQPKFDPNQAIYLDKLPFEQPKAPLENQKSTKPIIFES